MFLIHFPDSRVFDGEDNEAVFVLPEQYLILNVHTDAFKYFMMYGYVPAKDDNIVAVQLLYHGSKANFANNLNRESFDNKQMMRQVSWLTASHFCTFRCLPGTVITLQIPC
jgi:hypothetical protein